MRKSLLLALFAFALAACVPTWAAAAGGAAPNEQGQPSLAKRVLVQGTAVSIDGKPLPNVEGDCQSLSSGMLVSHWTSGSDGGFFLKLIPGKYRIWALGIRAKATDFMVTETGGDQHVLVTGRPHNGLLLRFESPDGSPLSNTRIPCGVRGGKISVKTDAGGFVVTGEGEGTLPLRMFFVKKGLGYAFLEVTSEAVLFGEDPLSVRLNSGALVSGRVLSEKDGAPVGGVPIFPVRRGADDDPWSWWNTQYGFKSYSFTILDESMAISRDGDGSFVLGPLPPGDYALVIGLPSEIPFRGADLIESTSRDLSVPTDKNIQGLDLRVSLREPACSLQGHISQSNGTPLSSAKVTVKVSGVYAPGCEPEEYYVWEPVVRTVTTDAQGHYRLYPVRPGTYKISVEYGAFSASRDLTVRDSTIAADFTLRQMPLP